MKSGSVAVIGRANAGKSTLINVLVGEKVSIVSPKPQTTRERIMGVLNEKDYQIVKSQKKNFLKSRFEDTLADQTDRIAFMGRTRPMARVSRIKLF